MKQQKTVKYGDVDLQVQDSNSDLVPKNPTKITLPKKQEQALAVAVANNMSCLLVGETGTGKTSAVRYIAGLTKQPYIRVNLNGHITPDELIGAKSAKNGSTYFEKGPIVQAMEQGAILVVDELNAAPPDTTFIFHSLLDDDRAITLPNGETVKPHKDFRFFATMNPDYAGTKILNAAFYDRFPIVVEFSVPKPEVEKALLTSRNVPEEYADMLMVFATNAREAYREQRSTFYVSTRSLIQLANLMQKGLSALDAFTLAILPKASKEEKEALLDIYNAAMKTNIKREGDYNIVISKKDRDDWELTISAIREDMEAERGRANSAVQEAETIKERVRIAEEQAKEASEREATAVRRAETIEKELETYKQLDALIKKVSGNATKGEATHV